MSIQMLDEYKNRTEYRMLKNFYDCQTASINKLQNGVLVLPGTLLHKMDKAQLNLLNTWTEGSFNQLILTPAWIETDLKNYFNLSMEIIINKVVGIYKEIPIDYSIISSAKDIVFKQDGNVFGINYRKNTGAGLITVIALPLLDYKLIQYEDKLKSLFDSLIKFKDTNQEKIMEISDFSLKNLHFYLIILMGANVDLAHGISEKIKKYFGLAVDKNTADELYNELLINKYIDADGLLDKGLEVVKNKKLKSFINVVKQRSEKEDGWS